MDSLTLSGALVIDALTVVICLIIASRQTGSALHPAWMFMGLHGYMVTFRLVQLYMGASPMRATFTWPLTTNEVLRAGVASDLGMLAMAVGWIVARAVLERRPQAKPKVLRVSKSRIYLGAALAIGIGIPAELLVGRLERVLRNASWDTSGYLTVTEFWPAWSVCLLHFLYGFPIPLIIVTAVVLVWVAIMSTSRFAVIISLMFLLFTWLSRRRGLKLPVAVVPGLLLVLGLWLPMKPLTRMLYRGAPVTDALNVAVRETYLEFASKEGAADLQYLDMVGSIMTLSDVRGEWYWGRTILPLFVTPIPRMYWPEKPNIVQYEFDLQVPSRSMADLGMTPGLVGEGYVDFGYAGVVLYFFAVGFAYAFAYLMVSRSYALSPSWLLYLFCLASAAQVYRDGLISAVWFPFVYGAPIAWTAVSHWIWKPGRGVTLPELVRRAGEGRVSYVR